MPSDQAVLLPDASSTVRAGWPDAEDGDMVCDPTSGRVMLYRAGAWQELSAASAYKLAAARTLTLAGDVTGSVATDLSGNVSLPTVAVDKTHVHNLAFAFGWRTSAFTGGAGTTYIAWQGSTVGGGATSPGHSGNSIRLGKAGWWWVCLNVMQSDTTGAGIRSSEVAVGVDLPGIERVNSDGAGRYAANPQGVIYSAGADTFLPHLHWTVATTINAAFFAAVWLRA